MCETEPLPFVPATWTFAQLFFEFGDVAEPGFVGVAADVLENGKRMVEEMECFSVSHCSGKSGLQRNCAE